MQRPELQLSSTTCYFASDLHGNVDRYRKLFRTIQDSPPGMVFLGGDLLPHPASSLASPQAAYDDFITELLLPEFEKLRTELAENDPLVFLIPGNDDGRRVEGSVVNGEKKGAWIYVHDRKVGINDYTVYGYAFVPPTPFLLKDWEKYDVSRYVDPGCVSPEEGLRSVPVAPCELRYSTIRDDLEKLSGKETLAKAVFLFHSPPYQTLLDRAALDGKMVDHAPLDVHVGSIAIRKFIETRQPLLTLHGHIHESSRLTGAWQDRIGRTHLFSAAYDDPELALVTFDLEEPDKAVRLLL